MKKIFPIPNRAALFVIKPKTILIGLVSLLIISCGDSPDSLMERGVDLMIEENYEEGVALIEQALLTGSVTYLDGAEVQAILGRGYLELKQYQRAESTIKKALELNPKHEGAYGLLLSLYDDTERYDDMMAIFDEAQAAGAVGPTAYNNMAILLWKVRKFDEAAELLQRALDDNSEDPLIWANLAVAHAGRKDEEESQRCFAKAKELGLPNPKQYAQKIQEMFSLKD